MGVQEDCCGVLNVSPTEVWVFSVSELVHGVAHVLDLGDPTLEVFLDLKTLQQKQSRRRFPVGQQMAAGAMELLALVVEARGRSSG